MNVFVLRFLDILITVLYVAIIARIILSWLPMGNPNNPLVSLVHQITEPILAPLRRIIPRVGFLDLTPMIAIIILGLIQGLLHSL